MDNKINIIEFDKRKSPVTQVAYRIEEAFKIFKDADLLIVNRGIKGDFFEVMAESMFEYNSGIVLVERFFKKDKCMKKGMKVEGLSQENKNLIREFTKFTQSVPKTSTLSDHERDEYSSKIKDYTDKIKDIKKEETVLQTYQYKKLSLAEFDLIDKDTLTTISNLYAGLCLNLLMGLSWSSLESVSIALTTVEHNDYIDLILIPVKQNDEN